MDNTQLLLNIVLIITTILLIVVGIQIIIILRDFRKILRKINQIINELEKIGVSLEHGFSEISGFLSAIKTIFKIINSFQAKKNVRNNK